MIARLAAASVHLLTASGAVLALLALRAVHVGDWQMLFVWLGAALVVDAVDGPLARRLAVTTVLPRFSGERLDLVVDYVTYVFVPALALVRAGYLSGTIGLAFAAAILLSSLYHFSDLTSKVEDYSFVGFPAVWNLVAFYIFALGLPAWATFVIVAACVVLTFVPMHWVHPLRVMHLRPLTLAVTLAWAVAAIAAIWHGFPAGPWTCTVLVLTAGYLVGLTALRWAANNVGDDV